MTVVTNQTWNSFYTFIGTHMAQTTFFSNCDFNLNIIRGRSKQMCYKSLQKFGQSRRHTHNIHYEKETEVLQSWFVTNLSGTRAQMQLSLFFFLMHWLKIQDTGLCWGVIHHSTRTTPRFHVRRRNWVEYIVN